MLDINFRIIYGNCHKFDYVIGKHKRKQKSH